MSIKVLARPNYLTVQVGNGQHSLLDPKFLQYINTNIFFDLSDRVVKAMNKIEIGKELTLFY